jgi:DNA-directed RNA polymerase specialized sigma subunit
MPTFGFVEWLLYNYKTFDTSIEELEVRLNDMLPAYSSSTVKFSHDKPHSIVSQQDKWANTLESKEGRELQRKIADLKRWKKAIHQALPALNDMESQLVFLFYEQEKDAKESWQAMHIEKSRFYELRQEVVYKIGRFLGLEERGEENGQ